MTNPFLLSQARPPARPRAPHAVLRRGAALIGSVSAVLLAAGAGFVACTSPTEDALIESLGPEVDGVPESEFHRYGQPCLACHDAYNGAEPAFSIAGTVFAQPDDEITVAGAKITVTDSTGQKKTMTSNCAGNFYVEEAEYKPVYPLRIEVVCTTPPDLAGVSTTYRNVMGTRVNRDGSCASCHDNTPASQTSPGRIFCMDGRVNNPYTIDPDCKGGPRLGDAASGATSSTGDGATTGGQP